MNADNLKEKKKINENTDTQKSQPKLTNSSKNKKTIKYFMNNKYIILQ